MDDRTNTLDYYRLTKDPGRRWAGWVVMAGREFHGWYVTRAAAQRALDRLVSAEEAASWG